MIGAGPAGLTAAYYLLQEGHSVTIYDAHEAPGGMMRYGIPRFRLPVDIIEEDIAPLRAMGAEFVCNTKFGRDISLESLNNDGFDAVFLAFGAQKATRMGIEGEESEGVISGIDYLNRYACGNPVKTGGNVLVIGGGNTAIDAARTALRLGAESVRILYRRAMEDMPANRKEIEESLSEGISIEVLNAPVSLERTEDSLRVTAVRMTLGDPDESGRCRPLPVENSEFSLSADLVISAVGQHVDDWVHDTEGITSGIKGTVLTDPGTCRTSVPWVFAGGDCVTGSDTAINAVRQGKNAARTIDAFLRGEEITQSAPRFHSSYGPRDNAPEGFYEKTIPSSRANAEEIPLRLRTSGFDEISYGLSEEKAREEAQRCMRCGCVSKNDCRLRELASTYTISQECGTEEDQGFSVERKEGGIRFEREKCVDCGICVRTLEETGKEGRETMLLLVERCPTGALTF